MKKVIEDRLLEQYKELMVDKSTKTINKLNLGFVEDSCFVPFISMTVHMMENIEIFNIKQLNNVEYFLNKLAHV